MSAVLAVTYMCEHIDIMLLTSMYAPRSKSLASGLAKVGTLDTCKGLVQVREFPAHVPAIREELFVNTGTYKGLLLRERFLSPCQSCLSAVLARWTPLNFALLCRRSQAP